MKARVLRSLRPLSLALRAIAGAGVYATLLHRLLLLSPSCARRARGVGAFTPPQQEDNSGAAPEQRSGDTTPGREKQKGTKDRHSGNNLTYLSYAHATKTHSGVTKRPTKKASLWSVYKTQEERGYQP